MSILKFSFGLIGFRASLGEVVKGAEQGQSPLALYKLDQACYNVVRSKEDFTQKLRRRGRGAKNKGGELCEHPRSVSRPPPRADHKRAHLCFTTRKFCDIL